MHPTKVKTIASFLSIIILANSLYFVLPNKVSAAGDGGASAVYENCVNTYTVQWVAAKVSGYITDLIAKPAVPENNGEFSWDVFWDDMGNCLRALWDMLLKIAFNKFKKRLLDRLTDDIVGWISGNGGKPKFVTDFNSVLKSSADAALGDTLQEIGAGQLCNANLGIQLKLNLQAPPKFSDSVSCTLSKAIGNVAAFGNNFQNGSWLALQELSAPQNNKYGLRLMAFDELDRKQSTKTDAVKTEAAGNSGFLSTKLCVKWSVIGQSPLLITASGALGPETVLATFLSSGNNNLIDPNKPPAEPPAETAALIPPGSKIKKIECKAEDQKITTPGGTLGTILGNSLGSNDKDALVNATDLTPYLSAIFDAAFNRLAKQGAKGLTDAGKDLFSNSSTNATPEPYCTSMPTGPNVTEAEKEKCRRDMIYLGYGSELVDATTHTSTSTNPVVVSTSTVISLASSTLDALNNTLAPLVATITALQALPQTTLPLLSACEAQKTAQKTQCSTTADLLSKLASISADINSANSLITVLQKRLADIITKLNDPTVTATEVLAISAEVQSYTTQINDLISKLNADKMALTSIDVNAQYQACASTPATGVYACPAPTGGGGSGGGGSGGGGGGGGPHVTY